jgi:hypothetical protein
VGISQLFEGTPRAVPDTSVSTRSKVSLELVGEFFEVRTQVYRDLTTVSQVDRRLGLIEILGRHSMPIEAAAVPRRYLRCHHDVTGEPPLFKATRLSSSRPPLPLPPLHHARHGRRLASRRPAHPLGQRAREHLPRDP